MKLPDRWISEFEEYKKQEFRGNEGIYDSFDPIQLDVIKAYFRWKTRKRFQELCKNTTLAAKPKKAEVLSGIMGNAIDWVYDGCVDTGYLGASHCALGHALRYEHYAFSASTNKSIIFGVNCAADFFGIEPDKLRKINTVQEETLEEIKIIAFILETGKHPEYFKSYYSDTLDVVKVMGEDWAKIFGADWNMQMANFWKLKLPFTTSMVDRLKWVKQKFYFQKVEDNKRKEVVSSLLGGDPKREEFMQMANNSQLHLVRASIGYISEYASDNSEYRIKCSRFVLDQAILFYNTYKKLEAAGVKDFDKLVNSGKRQIVYVHAKNGDRIATASEKAIMGSKAFLNTEYPLGEDKYKYLQAFGWAISGKSALYAGAGLSDINAEEIIKIEKSAAIVKSALKWLNSPEFNQDMRTLSDLTEVVYPEYANDEVESEKSLDSIVEYLVRFCPKSTKSWLFNTAYDIADKYMRYSRTITDKQAKVLRDAYNALTGEVEKPEIVKKAEYVVNNADDPILSSKYKLELDISKSVVTTGRASDKQKARVEIAYEFLKSGGAEGPNAPVNSQAKQIFIDEPDSVQRANKFSFGASDDTPKEVFVEKGTTYKTETTGVLTDMPSIVEISQLLGLGVFKIEEVPENE